MLYRQVSIIVFFFSYSFLYAQEPDSMNVGKIPSNYLASVSSKALSLENKLDKYSEKTLQQLAKKEAKLQRKLYKIDSAATKNIFVNSDLKYKELRQRITGNSAAQYIPNLDTLATSLKFLKENPQLLSTIKDGKEKLLAAQSKVDGLKDQFQKAEEIKKFLKERKEYLKKEISKFGFRHGGQVTKGLKKINKQAYYYAAQVKEYKEILKDPKKVEKKAIELLSKTKLFKDFFRKNSQLASLFPMPGENVGGNSSAIGFAGLQTRIQLASFVQQNGVNGLSSFSQLQGNVLDVQSQVAALRNKLKLGSGDNFDMPDFKPNSQKTKSFFKRLEFGSSFQSQKADRFFPATSDIGLSVGYKLNDESIIGIGSSYKVGWGKGFNNIKITNQGFGLRSFIEWKIKGSFWVTGGYEQNYRTQFQHFDQLKNLSAWQQSGLLGISKSISIKSKLLKQTKLQLLWDFLSYQQIPRTKPILFRVGYSF